MTIGFGYGGTETEPETSLLKIYVDDYNAPEAAEIRCTNTGGYDEANQKDFTFDCSVPSGVHTVYVKWAEAATGSLYSVLFTQAPAAAAAPVDTAAATDAAATAPADNTAAVTAPAAPSTGDNILAVFAVAALAAGMVVVFRRKIPFLNF